MGRAATAGADFLTAAIGAKAYHNHMEMSGGDVKYSMWQAAVAARRWRTFFWFGIVFVLMRLFGAWMWFLVTRPGFTDYTGQSMGWLHASILSAFPQVAIFGIMWCRNIDAALFKRGALYHIFAPLRSKTERINAGWLWAMWIVSFFLLSMV